MLASEDYRCRSSKLPTFLFFRRQIDLYRILGDGVANEFFNFHLLQMDVVARATKRERERGREGV